MEPLYQSTIRAKTARQTLALMFGRLLVDAFWTGVLWTTDPEHA